MNELQQLINKLQNADIEHGYIEEVLLDVIATANLEQATVNMLNRRFHEELKEIDQVNQESK